MKEQFIGYDIIIVAGQSNAAGMGQGGNVLDPLPNVYEINDKNLVAPKEEYGKENSYLNVIFPIQTKLEPFHEAFCNIPYADFSPTFVLEYIKNNLLKTGRKVLVVKTAVGGTCFRNNQWGVNNPLSNRLCEMVNYALNLPGNNKIVALLWHQGENDVGDNSQPELLNEDLNYKYLFYKDNFINQISYLRKLYQLDFPVICGGFSEDWKVQYKEQSAIIEKALYDSTIKLSNMRFVSSDGLKSNDSIFHDGDKVHFCRDAQYELGRRYFKAYQDIIK